MKIIDLLNKIANGEEVPKEVEYNNSILHYDSQLNDYCCDYEDDEGELHGEYLFTSSFESIANNLNDEVEILEEEKKIPEELPTWFSLEKDCKNDNIQYANYNFERMYEKINEICNYLKSKGDE